MVVSIKAYMKTKPKEISNDVYLVGDSSITDQRDCSVYVVDLGELILVDTGAGASVNAIIENMRYVGLDPARLTTIVLTHCHIDHVGGAALFRERYGARIVMHELDAAAVERGDNEMTGAGWYGVKFAGFPVDLKLSGAEASLQFGAEKLVCLHTPGHTPGSMSAYIDHGGQRILFGQDIHGPFLKEFGADMKAWQASMEKLLALKADVLCEGHFGVYEPAARVADYIERYLEEYGD